MNWKTAAAVGLALFLACPLMCGATSVKATGKSSYGSFPSGFLTPDGTPQPLGNGYTASLDNSDSNGTDSYLEIDTPNLLGGTTITISGLGNIPFFAVFCSPTSFLGSCDPDAPTPVITTAQLNCVATINENNPSAGTFTFTVPTCNITGNNTMALIFGDGSNLAGFDFSSINASPGPTTGVPEPSSLMLLGGGLVGLFIRRRSLRQAANAS